MSAEPEFTPRSWMCPHCDKSVDHGIDLHACWQRTEWYRARVAELEADLKDLQSVPLYPPEGALLIPADRLRKVLAATALHDEPEGAYESGERILRITRRVVLAALVAGSVDDLDARILAARAELAQDGET